ENNNQAIEPGEKLTLRIDATNAGTVPIAITPLTLSGTPSMIEAFGPALSTGPILLGPIPPGETRSTIIAGRMPASIQESRAELTLNIAPEAGISTTPVTIVATVQSGRTQSQNVRSSPPRPPSVIGSMPPQANRYAVIVDIDLYRAPW